MTAPFLRLLGSPSLVLPTVTLGQPAPGVKGLALLAFLTLEPGPHTREELAALLWGESPESAARGSLRQILLLLRQNLGDVLRVDRQTVELVVPPACDAVAFLRNLTTDRAGAVALDVPRFFSGFSLRDAPAFDEWVDRKRRELLHQYHQALHRLAQDGMARSRWQEAVGWVERWLNTDPLSDQATKLLLEALYLSGDRAGALAAYQRYRERLERELDSRPSPEITALAGRIEAGSRAAAPIAPAEPAPRRMPTFESPLTGREAQWGALAALWGAASAGRGRVTVIEGEPGLGKTRLSTEFMHWVLTQGGTVVRGRGYDPRAGIPYAPIAEALRGLLDAPGLAGTPPEWLAEAARLLPELRRRFPALGDSPTPTDAGERWRLFEGVAQLVLAVAAERPTLLLIDDLHLCDAESCTFLHFLARRLGAEAALTLFTVNPAELDEDLPATALLRALRAEPQTTVLGLQPLTEEEVFRVLHDMGRIKAPAGGRRFARKVFELSQGNPAYTVELVKTLFAAGVFGATPLSMEWVAWAPLATNEFRPIELPRSIRESVAQRVTRLSQPMRDVLETLAIAGQAVGPELLGHVHSITRLQAVGILEALVKRGLVTEEDQGFRCAHRIIQEVAAVDLTPAKRKELHRALALGLVEVTGEDEVAERAGRIAKHAEQGGERALAYREALEASDAASRRYALREASAWLDLARAAARNAAERDEVERRAVALRATPGWEETDGSGSPREAPAWALRKEDLDLRIVE